MSQCASAPVPVSDQQAAEMLAGTRHQIMADLGKVILGH